MQWIQTYYIHSIQSHGNAPSIKDFLDYISEGTGHCKAKEWENFNNAFEDKMKETDTKQAARELSLLRLKVVNDALQPRQRKLIDTNGAPTKTGKKLAESAHRERNRRKKR